MNGLVDWAAREPGANLATPAREEVRLGRHTLGSAGQLNPRVPRPDRVGDPRAVLRKVELGEDVPDTAPPAQKSLLAVAEIGEHDAEHRHREGEHEARPAHGNKRRPGGLWAVTRAIRAASLITFEDA